MPKTIILSGDTARNLIEAHASLAAWYYQLSDALHAAGAAATPPSASQRRAFVVQLAHDFPELGPLAATMEAPRPYLPPPLVQPPAAPPIEPPAPPTSPAAVAPPEPAPPPAQPPAKVPTPPATAAATNAAEPPAPPPMVDPSKVKYQE